jgi:NAD(P)-dependent dehydrogenase (short-subunit alcohol dehydrogenase family)
LAHNQFVNDVAAFVATAKAADLPGGSHEVLNGDLRNSIDCAVGAFVDEFITPMPLHPVGRLGEIDDVADTAIRYLSNASFASGNREHVDGGQSAGR